MKSFWRFLTRVAIATALAGATFTCYAQTPLPVNSTQVARQEILQSSRWRRVQRDFDEWLSVQRIYSAEEVARIRAEMAADIARMSPGELEAFVEEMDDRLDVLLSRDAAEARNWVSQFLTTARNAEQQIRDKRPDVMNLTAEEIRAELRKFQRQRASRQQAQSASDFARSQQVQSAQAAQAASSRAQDQMRQSRARASQNAQNQRTAARSPRNRPNYSEFTADDVSSPLYAISPWGTPIRWNALAPNNRN